MTKTVIDQALNRKTISESAMDQIATVVAQVRAQIEGQGAQEKYRARLECIRVAADAVRQNHIDSPVNEGSKIKAGDITAFAGELMQFVYGGE